MGNKSRHNVLKSISAVGFTAGGIGTVKGSSAEENSSPDSDTNFSSNKKRDEMDGGEMRLNDENRISKEEWIQRKDDETSGVGVYASGDPGENIDYHGAWEDESTLTASCWFSTWEIKTQTTYTVYKVIDEDGNIVTDGDGDYRFLVEMWAKHEVTDNGGTLCSGPSIGSAEQELKAVNDNTTFIDRDPKTKSRVNDERVTVSHSNSIQVGNVSIEYSRSSVVRFDDGRFGADSWSPGKGDAEYVVEWETTSDTGDMDYVDVLGMVEISSTTDGQFEDHVDSGLRWSWSLYSE
ncbi:MAG: hypothetical protein V5A34_09510 [Halapricum sp.]